MTAIELINSNYSYSISRKEEKWTTWENWYKQVVWYGKKKGAYLYDIKKRSKKDTEDKIVSSENGLFVGDVL